uniref:CUGBP Elav-like family member 4 n=1 Tax=Lygus hesperus TaxID=30085 RepID=A0A0A9Y569_LYGHE
MQTTVHNILLRTRATDKISDENVALHATREALHTLVEGAHALLQPMLTTEYTHGYHPWPAKMRNTTDPLSHILQTRYGVQEVIQLREFLATFNELYVEIHQFVSHSLVVPDINRPMTGRALEVLCARLCLNPLSSS